MLLLTYGPIEWFDIRKFTCCFHIVAILLPVTNRKIYNAKLDEIEDGYIKHVPVFFCSVKNFFIKLSR